MKIGTKKFFLIICCIVLIFAIFPLALTGCNTQRELNINLFFGTYQMPQTVRVEVFMYAGYVYSVTLYEVILVGIFDIVTGQWLDSFLEAHSNWVIGQGWTTRVRGEDYLVNKELTEETLLILYNLGNTVTLTEDNIFFAGLNTTYTIFNEFIGEEDFIITLDAWLDGMGVGFFRFVYNKSTGNKWVEFNADGGITLGIFMTVRINMEFVG